MTFAATNMKTEMFSDVEKSDLNVLYNDSVKSYSWDACTVEVQDRATGKPKLILDNVSGVAQAGKDMAVRESRRVSV